MNKVCNHVKVLLDLNQAVTIYEVLKGNLRWEIHPWLNQVEIADLLVQVEELPLLMDTVVVLVYEFLKLKHVICQLFYNEFSASKLGTADHNTLDREHYLNFEMVKESKIMA